MQLCVCVCVRVSVRTLECELVWTTLTSGWNMWFSVVGRKEQVTVLQQSFTISCHKFIDYLLSLVLFLNQLNIKKK